MQRAKGVCLGQAQQERKEKKLGKKEEGEGLRAGLMHTGRLGWSSGKQSRPMERVRHLVEP